MTKRFFALLMTLLLVTSAFAACDKKSSRDRENEKDRKNPIVGTWDALEKDYSITFEDGNTGEIFYDYGFSIEFDYEIKNGNQLTMINPDVEKLEFEFEIEDDILTLTDDDYQEEFKRIEKESVDTPIGKPEIQNSIVGSWETEKDGVDLTMTFKNDGTGKWKVTKEGLNINLDMEWECSTDEITMIVTYNGETQTAEGEYEIDGDTLVITVDGEREELRRVN